MATSLAKGCLRPCSENTCPPLCAAPECWEVKTLSKRMTSPACRLPCHHCPQPPWSGCFPIRSDITQLSENTIPHIYLNTTLVRMLATLSVCSLALTSPPHPHTSRLRVTWLKVELWLRFGLELRFGMELKLR